MKRNIYLEGEIGLKFGRKHSFHGESVRDALRLIQANNPELRKYLIACAEADIGFHIEVGSNEVETPLECLLPLREGDVVITPVAAGSKSGEAKILTAVAIAALLFIPGGANLILGYGSMVAPTSLASGLSAAGGAYATAGMLAATLAVNLALTGIQQLMAPDPSVDEEDEGYLFNGSQRNIVEGMPIPLLYGELRVPGHPVSFEVVGENTRVSSSIEEMDEAGNVFDGGLYQDPVGIAQTTSAATQTDGTLDSTGTGEGASSIANTPINYGEVEHLPSNLQEAVFTDIISEGPIYGLVDGGESVFLNDDPSQLTKQAFIQASKTPVTFSFTNGSTSVTINKNNYTKSIQADTDNGSKYIVIRALDTKSATVALSSLSNTKSVTITASSAFFASNYVYNPNNPSIVPVIRLLDSNSTTVFQGYVQTFTSSTVAVCTPFSGSDLNPALTSGSYTVVLDGKLQVASVAANETSLTLSSNFAGNTGTYKCDFVSTDYGKTSLEDSLSQGSKYDSFAVQFRTGQLTQPSFTEVGNTGPGVTAITNTPSNTSIDLTCTTYNDTACSLEDSSNATREYTTGAAGFNLTQAQIEQADQIRITFSYPQLWNRNEKGEQGEATARYTAEIAVEQNGSFGSYQEITDTWEHQGRSNAPLIFNHVIDLKKYQPFTDFKLKITRTTYSNLAYNAQTNTWNQNYTTQSVGSITSLSTIIKENLTYPLTAMAKIRLNSRDFQQLPTRTYHCKGLKVKVPSNYVTREESTETDNAPSYKRNVSNGSIESTYQDWDGNFRADKVYTNNPAWIFYDILTNNRYGLGEWLAETDIDKYALYRIARYCDEMVDDGNGGTEPRFTTNVYLTKATDAYKVVKDLASIFRSMIYWLDGEIYTVIDQPGDPVYNFSKANVIDGAFSYETTGSKTRANQIVVTWNNPKANYKLENLIVEDRQNIIKTGRLISENATAYGATSEGQALRYGRWKLWTAVNQTEIVSFKTAINAAFLAPGDIINVQDSDRHPGNLKYSGRVSNTGTPTTTSIPLDRSITLNSGSTYELTVGFTDSVATLAQDSATIGSTSYSRGDIIDISTIDTDPEASNIVDDSGNYVDITWKPYTNVETGTVTTSPGTVSSLTVSSASAFTTAPTAESLWLLRETIGGVEVLGSKKMYKILSIAEESKNEYGITAVEFYNEKYDSVDADFTLSTTDPLFSNPGATDVIPAPTNVYAHVSDLNSGIVSNDIIFYWDTPTFAGDNVSTDYRYVDHYLVSANIPGFPASLKVSKERRSLIAYDLPVGTFTVGIQTVSINGKMSEKTKTTFTIEDPARQAIPRAFGMALGATVSSPAFITSTGTFTFEDKEYFISPAGDPQLVKEFDGSPASEYTQDCSNIASVNFSAITNEIEKQLSSHYVMFDADASDPLTLIKYYRDDDLGYGYFYDAGTGNTTHTSNWTALTGTVSVAANSNRVVGSSTSFSSELAVGDIIKFSSTQAARVIYVASDTDVRIDKSFTTAISAGTTAYENTFKFDKDQDAVIAQIRNDGGTFKYFPVNLIVNPNLGKLPRSVIITADPTFFNFDSSGTLTTSYTNVVLTATAFGYKNPVFKFTGAGFTNSEISQSADTVFSAGTDFVATKTLDKVSTYSATDLAFTVTVAEELDESNTDKQSSANITIPFVQDGAGGAAGKLVRLTSDDYSVVYETATDGTTSNPSPSGTLTFTATASNFTDPYFKFTGDGITDETSYTDGTGDTDTFTYSIPSSTTGWAGNPLTIRVGVSEAADSTTEVAFDTISIFYVAEGADGDDGIDGYTVIVTNSAHSFTANSSGTVTSYSGSGTDIEVYRGSTQLNSVSGTPTTDQFSVSVSASGITAGTPSVAGTQYTIGDHSNMTGTNATITYTLNLEGTTSGTVKQTFSKSTAGADGAPGATGDDGLRFAEGYVYYNTATTSAPSGPGSGTLTWSTGAISGMNSGWQQSPPEMGAGASGQYYYARWTAQQTSDTDTTNSVTFGSVTLGHNFEGLVTFSSGDFQLDGSTITTIDGGNITTGTISLQALNSSTSFSESNHTFALATTGLSIGGTSYDTTAKFVSSHAGDCTALFCQYTGSDTDSFGLASVTDAGQAAGFSYGNSGTYGFGGTNYLTVCSASYLFQGFGGSSTETFSVANNGTIKVGNSTFVDASRNITCGTIAATGAITATGDITAFYSSDRRMKDNVTPIENSLEKVTQLGGYEFDWNHVSPYEGMHDIGVIAQEVLKVAPEAVAKRENDMLAVRYEKLVPLLIEAIKDLKKEVEELKRGSSK